MSTACSQLICLALLEVKTCDSLESSWREDGQIILFLSFCICSWLVKLLGSAKVRTSHGDLERLLGHPEKLLPRSKKRHQNRVPSRLLEPRVFL